MAADTAPSDVRALAAGLDALDSLVVPVPSSRTRTAWRAFWPTATAVVAFGGVWQAVALAGIKPSYALPSPADVWT
ncbi:MAG TPA: hypothetical protein VFC48_09150, partial [Cellulomonas sp.]|nr:hypothetical protein [Cellulomonas sp.]